MALCGGSAGGIALLAGCGADSSADDSETSRFGDGDVGVLNFLLTLEHIEAAFYGGLLRSDLLGKSEETIIGRFGQEEAEQAKELAKLIERMDAEPVAKPQTKFSFGSRDAALELAINIQGAVAAAYLGQITNLESASAMRTVLSIQSVEGRHTATVNLLTGRSFTPEGAFAEPVGAKEALATLEPFMVQ